MISVQNLTKKYDGFTAVDSLNLDVEHELFVFLGPNGAGKTTTIKMMTGLLRPTAGSVTVGGIDLLKNPVEAKRHFGLVPEQPYLFEKLTAKEFVSFMAAVYRVPRADASQRMDQLFDIFEMSDRVDDLIENFSHGMKQKVALIAALIHNPKVLFLDEPTIGLDPRAAHNLKEILRGLVNKGTTIFLSTHILEMAEKMCDRIGIIHKGKLLALGSLEELLSKSHNSAKSLEALFLELTGTTDMGKIETFLETQ